VGAQHGIDLAVGAVFVADGQPAGHDDRRAPRVHQRDPDEVGGRGAVLGDVDSELDSQRCLVGRPRGRGITTAT
jgi:hypothetical protein